MLIKSNSKIFIVNTWIENNAVPYIFLTAI